MLEIIKVNNSGNCPPFVCLEVRSPEYASRRRRCRLMERKLFNDITPTMEPFRSDSSVSEVQHCPGFIVQYILLSTK